MKEKLNKNWKSKFNFPKNYKYKNINQNLLRKYKIKKYNKIKEKS